MRNNLIILESVIILILYGMFPQKSPKPLFYGTQTNTGIWSKVSGPKQITVGVLTLPLKQIV